MTYLQLVNDLLVRLREREVNSVQDTLYSKLMGKLINDSKRRVEDSFNWNSLATTITITTSPGVFSYSLTGTNRRFKMIDVINDTNNYELSNKPITWLNNQFLTSGATTGDPSYYGINGIDSNGYAIVDIYPIPTGVGEIRFNMYLPQDDLSSDSTVLTVPYEPVIQGAYAVAVTERGEDGGLMAADAAAIYRETLGSYIAIESSRYVENDSWVVT
jgi:hypothetical protein